MKKLLLLVFAYVVSIKCKDVHHDKSSLNPVTKESQQVKNKIPLTTGCYIFNDNHNFISLEITSVEKVIKGKLIYSLWNKDKNSGTFTGHLENGILLGYYVFSSEGVESVREVAFKIKGDQLLEGYGELNAEGNAFKDVTTLHFNAEMPLKRINL
ncbi:MAG: hypothetical protein RSF34_13665 [Flavobacterium sp.]|uniref:Uncharacterized protein n=1 Tax=Flavobacterium plurextorum TaxID=1114867 RepID=A0ABX4CUW6_9FLAO|nr:MULTISPECIES: hypothetical protein [Flavobacterium]OXB08396.1 hypothetical protein B0A81_08745 [Flavobacterium plurextorum]PIF70687.1 hypothetical protein CLU99_1432 [Flavobacterium sp. 2]